MNLTILGCRAGLPADGEPSSGYLVGSGATTVLLDCGPGIATALSAFSTPERLDAVVISHLHIDHCYDLLPLGKAMLSREAGGVPLYVPAGGRDLLNRLAALFPIPTMPILNRAFDLAFDVREYTPGDHFAAGDLDVSVHALRHSAPNCGIRVGGGFAYTGDTGVTPALAEFAADVDVLLAEASLLTTDDGPHGHLSALDAARAATAARAKSLILTHFPTGDESYLEDRRAEARTAFPGDVHLARPGHTFAIGTAA